MLDTHLPKPDQDKRFSSLFRSLCGWLNCNAFDQTDLDMFTKLSVPGFASHRGSNGSHLDPGNLPPLSQGAASQITDAWLPRNVENCKRSQFIASLSEINFTNTNTNTMTKSSVLKSKRAYSKRKSKRKKARLTLNRERQKDPTLKYK